MTRKSPENPMMHPNFSAIDALIEGFQTTWSSRAFLVRAAPLPLIMGMISLAAARFIELDFENNPALMVLIDLPWQIGLGWYMAMGVRHKLLGEAHPIFPWPMDKSATSHINLRRSLLIWVSANFFFASVITGVIWASQNLNMPEFWRFALAILVYAGLIHLIRYALAYIPAAIGYPLSSYIRASRHPFFSLKILGTFLAAGFFIIIPAMIAFLTLAGLTGQTELEGKEQAPFLLQIFELIIFLIIYSVANMSFISAVSQIMGQQGPKKPRD